MPSRRRATSPHPRAAKARAPLTAPHNTRPCPALLLAPLQRAAPPQGIKGCQSVWLCSAVGVIHSSFAQTGLCVHLTGAGLLNQRGERTHTGTGLTFCSFKHDWVSATSSSTPPGSATTTLCLFICFPHTCSMARSAVYVFNISFVSSVSASALQRHAIPETQKTMCLHITGRLAACS